MQNGLTPRQWSLKRFLERNFVSGRFFTIEELVKYVTDTDGNQWYKLNLDPYTHDKCIALASDIKAINWNCCEGDKIIVKNSKGGAKLCESKEEFDAWREKELAPVIKKYEYLNNLKWKAARDGMMPIINHANNVVPLEKLKPVEVYADAKPEKVEKNNYITLDIWGNEMVKYK